MFPALPILNFQIKYVTFVCATYVPNRAVDFVVYA